MKREKLIETTKWKILIINEWNITYKWFINNDWSKKFKSIEKQTINIKDDEWEIYDHDVNYIEKKISLEDFQKKL